MLGDVAVAVHPDDSRYKDLVRSNRRAILPFVGRPLPIIADEYSDPEKGTGAVKITPAHDFNDFDVWQRHKASELSNCKLINIFDQEAHLLLSRNMEFKANIIDSFIVKIEQTIADLNGEDRFVARKRIVAALELQNLMEKIEAHTHTVPHGDRSEVIIEPDQRTNGTLTRAHWRNRPLQLSGRDVRYSFPVIGRGRILIGWKTFNPGASRASYGGNTEIPAWYGPTKNQFGYDYAIWQPFVAPSEHEALNEASKRYGMPAHVEPNESAAAEYGLSRPDKLDQFHSGAMRTCSTPGSPRRCGRSPPWDGRSRQRSLPATIRPTCW